MNGMSWNNPNQAVDPAQNAQIAGNLNQYYTNELAAINKPHGQSGPAYGQAMPAMPEPPKFDPFSRPGDGRGDAEMRQQQYESMLKQAGTGSDLTRNQREALIGSAQAMLAPGLQQGKQQADIYQNQVQGYLGQMQAGFPGYPGLNSVGAPQQPLTGATSPYSLQKSPTLPGQANQPQTGQAPSVAPSVAQSALPATDRWGNSNALANNMNSQANALARLRGSA